MAATSPSYVRSHDLHTQSCEKEKRQQKTHISSQTLDLWFLPLFGKAWEMLLLGCAAIRYAGIARTIGDSIVGRKKPVANKFSPVSSQRDSHSFFRRIKNLTLKGYAINFINLPFRLLDRVRSNFSVLWYTVIHIHADFSNKCSLTEFIC